MSSKILKIATRESPLAIWQANHIREKLLTHWPNLHIELVPMKTTGDKFLKDKLLTIGGKGLFVKELEEALLDKRADLAVHSMKDVPVDFPKGLMLATICKRHNPFDAFVSKRFDNLKSLPKDAIVGTVSLRRQTQLLAIRSDLTIKPLRGNILTRIRRMESGDYDAIILAISGLERMGKTDYIREIFTEEQMLPACGQGALGIECRENDEQVQSLLVPLNDPLTSLCVKAERQVNKLLGGSCHSPLAVYCSPCGPKQIHLQARLFSVDGTRTLNASCIGAHSDSQSLAQDCAEELLGNGAAKLINDALKS